jgi:hypothetical protein
MEMYTWTYTLRSPQVRLIIKHQTGGKVANFKRMGGYWLSYGDGGWAAKLVARPRFAAALWVQIQTSLKNLIWAT